MVGHAGLADWMDNIHLYKKTEEPAHNTIVFYISWNVSVLYWMAQFSRFDWLLKMPDRRVSTAKWYKYKMVRLPRKPAQAIWCGCVARQLRERWSGWLRVQWDTGAVMLRPTTRLRDWNFQIFDLDCCDNNFGGKWSNYWLQGPTFQPSTD